MSSAATAAVVVQPVRHRPFSLLYRCFRSPLITALGRRAIRVLFGLQTEGWENVPAQRPLRPRREATDDLIREVRRRIASAIDYPDALA